MGSPRTIRGRSGLEPPTTRSGRLRRGFRGRLSREHGQALGGCRQPREHVAGRRRAAGKQRQALSRDEPAARIEELQRAQLYRRIKNQNGGWGYDQLFARFYVKFAPDCGAIHHFGTAMGGNWPATPWPLVSAGKPPDGAKSFWTGIEPFGKSWTWDYYTYWCEMRGSPPRGETWGNSFIRDLGLTIERGKWICVELMMKANEVGDSNGGTGSVARWQIDQPSRQRAVPRGAWIWDKFEPGKGGDGIRWSGEKSGREDFKGSRRRSAIPKASAGGPSKS